MKQSKLDAATQSTERGKYPVSAGAGGHRPKFHSVLPKFLRLFLPWALVITLAAYLLFLNDQSHQMELRTVSTLHRVELARSNITLTFHEIIADLRYLAESDAVRRLVAGEPGARAALAADMLSFSRHKGIYDQVRFLDAAGQERVRVNYNAGRPGIVPDQALQNKAGRYYVTDTMRLAGGEVFVSPLDLNIERGQIERPLKPMIRFGAPIIGANGEKVGMLLLNYLAAAMLERFQSTAEHGDGSLSLLNRDGYWLSGPDSGDEWNFMFPQRRESTFGNRYPGAWKNIQDSETGRFQDQTGLFVFTTVYPVTPGLHSSTGSGRAFSHSGKQLKEREYHWKVVARYPSATALDMLSGRKHWGLYLLALLGTALAAWFRARTQCQERLMVDRIQRSRDKLEERVAERTRELQESHQQLELLLESTGEGLYGIDNQGCCTFVNRACLQLLGFRDPGEVLGSNMHDLIHHHRVDNTPYPQEECPIFDAFRRGEGVHMSDETLWRADGEGFPAEIRSHPIQDDGEVTGAVVTFSDTTERKKTEERIRTLSQAVEQSPVSVLITDTEGNIEYVNSAFELVSGYLAEDVIGRNPRILKSGNMPAECYQALWQTLLNGDSWDGEFQNRHKGGTLYWDRAHISPVLDDTGRTRHYLAIMEDITEQKEQEERLYHQAHFDAVTGLPNRFLALDRLSQMLKEAERSDKQIAVIFLDLDDFKKINDTLGHDCGDRVLVQAAGRLRNALRKGDTVGRLGGDEFIVLLGGLRDAADARPVADNLLRHFRAPFDLDGRKLVLTASLGIALYPDDGDSAETLLRNADTAMYQSKGKGRNTYHYYTAGMNQDVRRRLALEEQLRSSLDAGELRLCYQPIIDLKTRQTVGAEALLRWSSAVLGEVSPAEFIPVAEQIGLIEPIGQYVLQEALRQMAGWRRRYSGFRVAVNVSPRQFDDTELQACIEDALDLAELPGQSLELEITEGVLMNGHAHISETLTSLKSLGVGFALDDFGTGYSSLNYLRRYPFDTLKIDRSFVSDLTVDPSSRKLISAAISMAHGLHLKVVAEGVETREQLDYLGQQGCDLAQGYLFGRPMSAVELEKKMELPLAPVLDA